MAIRLQIRRDTAAGWSAANPTLLEGEIGYIMEGGKVVGQKVGDGSTTWNNLPVLAVINKNDLGRFYDSRYEGEYDSYTVISLDSPLKAGSTIVNRGVPIILFNDAAASSGRVDVGTGATVALAEDKKRMQTGVSGGKVDVLNSYYTPYSEYNNKVKNLSDASVNTLRVSKPAYSNIGYSDGRTFSMKAGSTVVNRGVPIILFSDTAASTGRVDVGTGKVVVLTEDKNLIKCGAVAGEVYAIFYTLPEGGVGMPHLSDEIKGIIGNDSHELTVHMEKAAFSNIVLDIPIPAGYYIDSLGGYSGELLIFQDVAFDTSTVRRISSSSLPYYVDSPIQYLRANTAINHDVTCKRYSEGLIGNIEKIRHSLFTDSHSVRYKGNLAAGDVVEIVRHSVKGEECYALSGEVDTLGTLRIGHGKPSDKRYSSAWVDIDATNVKVTNHYSSDSVKTYPHGLTIGQDLKVIIRRGYDTKATIMLSSGGGVFTQEIPWDGCNGAVFVQSVDAVMHDVSMSWYCKKLSSPVWVFGDSYLSLTEARWPYYLLDAGYSDVLLNGYPGQNSATALSDLKSLLAMTSPKCVVWCLGMNDADSDSAVNSSWKSVADSARRLCELHGVEFIGSTIPTVKGGYVEDSGNYSLRVHKFKNDIVRSSGERYIDFDLAVGATEAGEWYAGMLSSDGVHPTASGAKALFMQALADAPELVC